MTSIDKLAVVWTIAIVAIGVGIALLGDQLQSSTAPPSTPTMEVEKAADTTQPTISKPIMKGWDRVESVQDPGVGHETHQLAIILPPSDKVYSGKIQYDASEPIQLVTLHGPLGPGEDNGQPIWTPDGKTKFALTFVDQKKSRGSWDFAGNALAVHTMKTTPFTTDYKLDYEESKISDTVMTGVVESIIDPGVGHESHSLAIIIPPSEKIHTGILSYSASEPMQLVSLNGPLGSDESPDDLFWTPDGTTIFELTFIDRKTAMGSWKFSGNGLALHTLNTNGFSASYSVATTVKQMEKEEVMKLEEEPPAMTGPVTVEVSLPFGTSLPGCEETNECYIPATVSINAGDTVTWSNDDSAPHTVTSGIPPVADEIFDSGFLNAGSTFEHTFDSSGTVDYYCMVHPWMTGSVQVS